MGVGRLLLVYQGVEWMQTGVRLGSQAGQGVLLPTQRTQRGSALVLHSRAAPNSAPRPSPATCRQQRHRPAGSAAAAAGRGGQRGMELPLAPRPGCGGHRQPAACLAPAQPGQDGAGGGLPGGCSRGRGPTAFGAGHQLAGEPGGVRAEGCRGVTGVPAWLAAPVACPVCRTRSLRSSVLWPSGNPRRTGWRLRVTAATSPCRSVCAFAAG